MPQIVLSRLDAVDAEILQRLATDARMPMSDLARVVGLSAPSTSERVRKLESAGVLRGFTIDLNPKAVGYTLEAIVRIKPRPGQLHIIRRMIEKEPRFVACDEVTGEDCFIARLWLAAIEDLDPLLAPFHERASTNTAMVKSAQIRGRLPPLPVEP